MRANIEPAKAAFASAKVIPNPKDRRLARVRLVNRVKHLIRTEQAHVDWIIGFSFFSEETFAREKSRGSAAHYFFGENAAHN